MSLRVPPTPTPYTVPILKAAPDSEPRKVSAASYRMGVSVVRAGATRVGVTVFVTAVALAILSHGPDMRPHLGAQARRSQGRRQSAKARARARAKRSAAAERCASLGFADSLQCTSCDRVESGFGAGNEKVAELVGECRSCCNDAPASGLQFVQATLEVCS